LTFAVNYVTAKVKMFLPDPAFLGTEHLASSGDSIFQT
jgi:hypothetical protein